MNDDRPPPIELEYAAPPIFFQGEFRTRTAFAILGAAISSAVGVATLFFVALSPRMDSGGRTIIGGLGVALIAIAAWSAWQWSADVVRPVRVTADGVEASGRFWAWPRIARIEGRHDGGGVVLVVHTRGVVSVGRSLYTTPPLTEDAYHVLRVELEHFFRTRGIDVKVDREILWPSTLN